MSALHCTECGEELTLTTYDGGSSVPSSAYFCETHGVHSVPPLAPDIVRAPGHYAMLGTEVIEVIAASSTLDEFRGYCRGNVIKYRLRAGKKDDAVQDLAKADFYLELFDLHKERCRDD